MFVIPTKIDEFLSRVDEHLFSYFVVPVATGMGDCSENRIANRLQHFYVIPTPAEGGEESRAIAKAKAETPRYARSDMSRSFWWAVVPRWNRGMKDSGEGRNP